MTEMNEKISLEANYILGELQTSREKLFFFRKIRKVADVKVETYLKYNDKMKYISYNISFDSKQGDSKNHNCCLHSKYFDGTLSHELVYSILIHLNETLPTLKFDKVTQNLTANPFFEDFDKYMDVEECCVCFSMTETKTDCNHTPCLVCLSSKTCLFVLKTCSSCPLCKKKGLMLKNEDDVEDDEE